MFINRLIHTYIYIGTAATEAETDRLTQMDGTDRQTDQTDGRTDRKTDRDRDRQRRKRRKGTSEARVQYCLGSLYIYIPDKRLEARVQYCLGSIFRAKGIYICTAARIFRWRTARVRVRVTFNLTCIRVHSCKNVTGHPLTFENVSNASCIVTRKGYALSIRGASTDIFKSFKGPVFCQVLQSFEG